MACRQNSFTTCYVLILLHKQKVFVSKYVNLHTSCKMVLQKHLKFVVSAFNYVGDYTVLNILFNRCKMMVVDIIPGRFHQKSSFQSSSTNAPPCVAKKGAVQEVQETIRFTARSKSFKRSIPGY